MAQVDAQIDLVEWCKSERSRLQQALDLLRASKFRAGKKTVGSRWVDTTAAGIERIISCIDELDKLLAESERRSRAG